MAAQTVNSEVRGISAFVSDWIQLLCPASLSFFCPAIPLNAKVQTILLIKQGLSPQIYKHRKCLYWQSSGATTAVIWSEGPFSAPSTRLLVLIHREEMPCIFSITATIDNTPRCMAVGPSMIWIRPDFKLQWQIICPWAKLA